VYVQDVGIFTRNCVLCVNYPFVCIYKKQFISNYYASCQAILILNYISTSVFQVTDKFHYYFSTPKLHICSCEIFIANLHLSLS